MVQQEHCHGCDQKDRCSEVYQRLGNSKSPSVVLKVLIAFLLPMAVFIGSLAAFERVLAGTIATKKLATAVNVVLALSVTFAVIVIIRLIRKQLDRNR